MTSSRTVLLQGHLRDPFPDMLDGQVQAYKKLMSTVPFNFPTKFYVNYSVNYEYADVKYRKVNN